VWKNTVRSASQETVDVWPVCDLQDRENGTQVIVSLVFYLKSGVYPALLV
jgi:hypothetical protein